MPKASHQADNRLRPWTALQLAKGAPLSLRMAPGKPWRSKSRSKLLCTVSVRASPMARNSNKVTAVLVADGQRFAPQVASPPPALKIHRPDLVSCLGPFATEQPPAFAGLAS